MCTLSLFLETFFFSLSLLLLPPRLPLPPASILPVDICFCGRSSGCEKVEQKGFRRQSQISRFQALLERPLFMCAFELVLRPPPQKLPGEREQRSSCPSSHPRPYPQAKCIILCDAPCELWLREKSNRNLFDFCHCLAVKHESSRKGGTGRSEIDQKEPKSNTHIPVCCLSLSHKYTLLAFCSKGIDRLAYSKSVQLHFHWHLSVLYRVDLYERMHGIHTS